MKNIKLFECIMYRCDLPPLHQEGSCHWNTKIPNTKNRPNLGNHPFQLLLCWQMSKPHHHCPKLLFLLTANQLMLTINNFFYKKSFFYVDTFVVIVPSPSISNSKKASLISSTFINDLEDLSNFCNLKQL